MSVKKSVSINGLTAPDAIYRVERIDCIGKPSENRYVIVNGNIYADDAHKASNQPFDRFCLDLKGAAAEAVLTATDKDAFAATYVELKKEGMILNAGTDC
jgi:hypothetical protein